MDKSKANINWFLVSLAYFAMIAMSMVENGKGPLYPSILSSFGITAKTGSWYFTLTTVFSLITYIASKYWLPILGAVKSTRLGLVLIFISSGIYYSAGAGLNITLLLIASALLGVGIAFASISINILVVNGTPRNQRRKYLSALHAIYGLFSFLAPVVISLMYKLNFKSEFYFLFTALLALGFLAINYLGNKEVTVNRSAKMKSTSCVSFWVKSYFGLIIGLCVSAEMAISTRLPLMLYSAGLDHKVAGLFLGGFFVALMLSRLYMAVVQIKLNSSKIVKLCMVLIILLFFLGKFVSIYFYPTIGLFVGPIYPTMMDFLAGEFKENYDEVAASVLTFVAGLTAIMHFVFGAITDHYGVDWSMLLVPILTVMALTLFSKKIKLN